MIALLTGLDFAKSKLQQDCDTRKSVRFIPALSGYSFTPEAHNSSTSFILLPCDVDDTCFHLVPCSQIAADISKTQCQSLRPCVNTNSSVACVQQHPCSDVYPSPLGFSHDVIRTAKGRATRSTTNFTTVTKRTKTRTKASKTTKMTRKSKTTPTTPTTTTTSTTTSTTPTTATTATTPTTTTSTTSTKHSKRQRSTTTKTASKRSEPTTTSATTPTQPVPSTTSSLKSTTTITSRPSSPQCVSPVQLALAVSGIALIPAAPHQAGVAYTRCSRSSGHQMCYTPVPCDPATFQASPAALTPCVVVAPNCTSPPGRAACYRAISCSTPVDAPVTTTAPAPVAVPSCNASSFTLVRVSVGLTYRPAASGVRLVRCINTNSANTCFLSQTCVSSGLDCLAASPCTSVVSTEPTCVSAMPCS